MTETQQYDKRSTATVTTFVDNKKSNDKQQRQTPKRQDITDWDIPFTKPNSNDLHETVAEGPSDGDIKSLQSAMHDFKNISKMVNPFLKVALENQTQDASHKRYLEAYHPKDKKTLSYKGQKQQDILRIHQKVTSGVMKNKQDKLYEKTRRDLINGHAIKSQKRIEVVTKPVILYKRKLQNESPRSDTNSKYAAIKRGEFNEETIASILKELRLNDNRLMSQFEENADRNVNPGVGEDVGDYHSREIDEENKIKKKKKEEKEERGNNKDKDLENQTLDEEKKLNSERDKEDDENKKKKKLREEGGNGEKEESKKGRKFKDENNRDGEGEGDSPKTKSKKLKEGSSADKSNDKELEKKIRKYEKGHRGGDERKKLSGDGGGIEKENEKDDEAGKNSPQVSNSGKESKPSNDDGDGIKNEKQSESTDAGKEGLNESGKLKQKLLDDEKEEEKLTSANNKNKNGDEEEQIFHKIKNKGDEKTEGKQSYDKEKKEDDTTTEHAKQDEKVEGEAKISSNKENAADIEPSKGEKDESSSEKEGKTKEENFQHKHGEKTQSVKVHQAPVDEADNKMVKASGEYSDANRISKYGKKIKDGGLTNEHYGNKTQTVKVHESPLEESGSVVKMKKNAEEQIEELFPDKPEDYLKAERDEKNIQKWREWKDAPFLEPGPPTGWQKLLILPHKNINNHLNYKEHRHGSDSMKKSEQADGNKLEQIRNQNDDSQIIESGTESKQHRQQVSGLTDFGRDAEKLRLLKESARQSDKENVKETGGGRNGKKPKLSHSSLGSEQGEKEKSNEGEEKEEKQKSSNKLELFTDEQSLSEENKQKLHHSNSQKVESDNENELETSSQIVLKQLKQLQYLAQSQDPDPKKINVSALHPATLRILKKLDDSQHHNNHKLLDKEGLMVEMKLSDKTFYDKENSDDVPVKNVGEGKFILLEFPLGKSTVITTLTGAILSWNLVKVYIANIFLLKKSKWCLDFKSKADI